MSLIFSTNYFYETLSQDNKTSLSNEIRQEIFNDFCEENGWDSIDEVPDEMVDSEIQWRNDEMYSDFCYQMEQFFYQGNILLMTGEINLWNRSITFFRPISSVEEIESFFEAGEYISIEDDLECLRLTSAHHDGTNYAMIKKFSDEGFQRYKELIEDNISPHSAVKYIFEKGLTEPFSYYKDACSNI